MKYQSKKCEHCLNVATENGTTMCRAEPPKVFVFPMQKQNPFNPQQVQVHFETVAAWPTVRPDHWCGKYEPSLVVVQ
jgi:hypothetical protein